MGHAYRAVGWNRQKRVYDTALALSIALCITLFVALTLSASPLVTAETLLIRSFGASAFVLLHVILSIGPACRLDPRFLPLLYNRRHLGVAMFVLALAHGTLAFVLFHTLGVLSPLESLFTSDAGPGTIPFQPLGAAALAVLFLMAATSHDFWLRNLTPPTWKALHMAVYVAYALVVLHVGLGFLQANTSGWLVGATAAGSFWLLGLHLVAAHREHTVDRGAGKTVGEWIDVGELSTIPDGRAKTVCAGGERVAIYRYGDKLSALSSVCRHQNGPLGEGRIVDGCVVCPWHGYQYRPRDGRSPEPFTERVPTFRVRVENGRVLLDPRPLPPGTPVEPAQLSNAKAPADERELYVGYLPHSPPRQARFTRGVVLAVFTACLAVVALIALEQAPLRAGQFEFGVVREFRGVLESAPHPLLRVQRPGDGVSSYLLVAPGKHGADELVRDFDGRGVTLRGSLVHAGERTMIEIEPGSLALADVTVAAPSALELGRRTLRGEIVDSKCHLGVMTPGERRTHRACAQLCIRGGIPPLFWVEDDRGGVQRLLLVGARGEAVNERVLDLVGLPLEIEGLVTQHDDWLVLSSDPAGYRRIAKEQ